MLNYLIFFLKCWKGEVLLMLYIVKYSLLFYQNPDVIEKWEAGTGIVVKDGYGQSETVSKTL